MSKHLRLSSLILPLLTMLALVTSARPPAPAQAAARYAGVNLAGADFGESRLPGVYGTDYIYPNRAEVDYFVAKGMNIFRLPFRWERLQRSLNGAFDATEQARMDDFVSYATGKGAAVLLDPHNYARYNGQIIGSGVPVSAFADFWSKLANHYKGNSRVIFGLMNEPHTMSTELWRDDAQAAINAIRATGATNLILVPGNAWSGAHSWFQTWYGTSNASVMRTITDPANNYAFEVHQYLDSDYSGTSDACVSTTIGAEKLAQFTSWLKQNGKKGFLGEFGGGRNSTCYAALDNMLAHIDANSDVWLGWTYWAAGPWWADYIFTLEPTNNFTVDRPQMAPLSKHFPGSTPTATRTATQGGTNPTATRTRTRTPTQGGTNPTATRTRTPTQGGALPTATRTPTQDSGGGTCSPATAITAPYTRDGSGTFCWQIATIPSYINSWNLSRLTVNGVDFTNKYATPSQLPAKINGYWYISYTSSVAWGHFEAR